MSLHDMNPYEPPDSKAEARTAFTKHHLLCFVIPTVLGYFIGGITLGSYVGSSPSDPFGTGRGAAVGGLLGLFVGFGIYVAMRATRDSKITNADNS